MTPADIGPPLAPRMHLDLVMQDPITLDLSDLKTVTGGLTCNQLRTQVPVGSMTFEQFERAKTCALPPPPYIEE